MAVTGIASLSTIACSTSASMHITLYSLCMPAMALRSFRPLRLPSHDQVGRPLRGLCADKTCACCVRTIVTDQDRLQGVARGNELEDDLEDALRPEDCRHLLRDRYRLFRDHNRQRRERANDEPAAASRAFVLCLPARAASCTLISTAACTMTVSYTSKASKYSFRNVIATNAERAVLMDRKISCDAKGRDIQSRCGRCIAVV